MVATSLAVTLALSGLIAPSIMGVYAERQLDGYSAVSANDTVTGSVYNQTLDLDNSKVNGLNPDQEVKGEKFNGKRILVKYKKEVKNDEEVKKSIVQKLKHSKFETKKYIKNNNIHVYEIS
jgi:hypothetical protein